MNEIFIFIGFIITIISWFINSYLNRKNEILKTTFKYQLWIYEEFTEIYFSILKNNWNLKTKDWIEILKLLTELQKKVILYLNKKEQKIFNELAESIKNNDNKKSLIKLNEFYDLCKKNIRKKLYIR